MRRWMVLVAVAFVIAPTIGLAVNEVQIGMTEAYLYDGGLIRVPLILTNDHTVQSWDIAFRITASGPLAPESVSVGGRLVNQQAVVMADFHPQKLGGILASTDSLGAMVVLRPEIASILPGSGTICNLWFSGAQLGDVISFEVVDSLNYAGPDGPPIVTLTLGTDWELRFPTGKTTTLTVVYREYEVTVPSTITGYTLRPMTIPVSAIGADIGVLQILDFQGPNGPFPFPAVNGNGPWEITWTPGLHGQGAYLLTIRLSNAVGQVVDRAIAISIVPSVLTGDIDCNGNVDLSDLTRMINWLLNGTLPPICP